MRARGPDDSGVWLDGAGVGFAHRRLSVVDVSKSGHQPMMCSTGRFVIVFNGEIYNHLSLRRTMEQERNEPQWRGHSDTETLLHGFVAWGIRATVERCVGMFAFAVWDRREQVLVLGRDRMGEKPLYFGWQGQGQEAVFLFASQLNALKAHPGFSAGVNRDALHLLMRHSCVPAPHSIYEGISKLQPGHLMTVSLNRPKPQLQEYWSLAAVAEAGISNPLDGSSEQLTIELEALLKSAVGQQMVADVPLGAFLSGGIDSSTVVALMQAQSRQRVKTFSIGFYDSERNEATHARAVAQHLGTDHTELYVSGEQALEVIPLLPKLYDEPFSDSSQIPTFLVSQLARQHVTVALSGDGGDELFAGYNRYVLTRHWWRRLSYLPLSVRVRIAACIRSASPNRWSALLRPIQPLLPRSLRMADMGDKLHKSAAVLGARGVDELYQRLVSHWDPELLVIGGKEPNIGPSSAELASRGLDDTQQLMAKDAMAYLPNDILVKLDRAAMAVSLEGRVPFLDHRVVEFAWRVPVGMNVRNGAGKWLLRQVLYRHVPRSLVERPKMGFSAPLDSWLKGPLRDWAEAMLDVGRLRREGYFVPEAVRAKWADLLDGRAQAQYLLWDVLMFQSWLQEQRAGEK